jgi:hypothetical protein
MNRKASSYSWLARWGAAAGMLTAVMTQSAPSRAEEIPATGKGIAGGALLGGELVMLVEAAVGVKSGWLYVVGGIVGAGGGAYGGYVVEQEAESQVSVYMLAGGMALVIPTIVAVLQATSYKAPEDYTEDKPAAGAPVPEPPRPAPGPPPSSSTSSSPSPTTHRYHGQPAARLKLPAGLLDLDRGALKVAVPAVEIRPLYRPDEVQKYGLEQKHELRVPVFTATF